MADQAPETDPQAAAAQPATPTKIFVVRSGAFANLDVDGADGAQLPAKGGWVDPADEIVASLISRAVLILAEAPQE